MLKLEMYARKRVGTVYANESDAKPLFDYISAKNQIFLNEASWEEIRK